MKKNIVFSMIVLVGIAIGVVVGRGTIPAKHDSPGSDPKGDILYWVAPMDPNFRQDGPGKSPMGMDLVPVYAADDDSEPGVVSISPVLVNNLGVRTADAELGSLPRRIDTVGYISYDEDTVQHVHTRVDGWIEKLATKASGDRVSKGQLLFELYSPQLVSAQEEFLAVLRSGNKSLIDASRARLLALGVTASQVARLEQEKKSSERVQVYAASDGVIGHLGVREGIFVTPSTEVMSVAKLDPIWVLAEVFERQANWVAPGHKATVTLDYAPGLALTGLVDYIYPELDPVTRTLKVRLRFDNSEEVLRPNMFAQVTIFGRETGDTVHIPKQAVIRDGSTNRVVVSLGDGRFRSTPVVVGIESGDRVAIRSGIEAGDTVVTSAQFLIDSEANIENALERYNEGGTSQ